MPVERPSGEGQGIGQQHKSLGRRVREYGAVLTLAPGVFLGSGLPAVSALQESSLQPSAIVAQSTMQFTEMQSLDALGSSFPNFTIAQEAKATTRTQSQDSCVGVGIPGDQLPSDANVVTPPDYPDGIRIANDPYDAGTFISTDYGQHYTYVPDAWSHNNDGLQWSPHTTNGKVDTFVAQSGAYTFSLFHTTDGCNWDNIATGGEDVNSGNEVGVQNDDGVRSWNTSWSDDGTTATIEVEYAIGPSGPYDDGIHTTITLNLNGNSNVQTTGKPNSENNLGYNFWNSAFVSGLVHGCLFLLEIGGAVFLVSGVLSVFDHPNGDGK